MKRYLLFVLLLLCSLFPFRQSAAQSGGGDRVEEYINRYKHMAIAEMKRTNIPASITLAQGIVESDFGSSYLVKKANNHFGIKCHRDWTGKRVYMRDDRPKDCFRKYGSDYDSFEDHSEFLARNDRYGKLFAYSQTDYKKWAKGLKSAGYATNPQYAQRLIHIIEAYGLHEYDYYVSEDPQCFEATTATPTYHKGLKVVIFNCDVTVGQAAEAYNLSPEALMRYNRLMPDAVIPAFTLVYLQQNDGVAPSKIQRPVDMASGELVPDVAALYGIGAEAYGAGGVPESRVAATAAEPERYVPNSQSRPLPPLQNVVASAAREEKPASKQPVQLAAVSAKPSATAQQQQKAVAYAAPVPVANNNRAAVSGSGQHHSLKHIVKEDETLFSISRKYKTTVKAIQRVNNLGSSTLIKAGLGLFIPAAMW